MRKENIVKLFFDPIIEIKYKPPLKHKFIPTINRAK